MADFIAQTAVDLRAIAERVLTSKLDGIVVDAIRTSTGTDHDGDLAVFVNIEMPSGAPIISARLLGDARVALIDTLRDLGDTRLIYVSVDWPKDEVPASPDVPT